MLLKILGTGSDGNCYVLQDQNEACIIEAGVSAKKVLKAINYEPSKVTRLLISHNHGDHAQYRDEILNTLTGDLQCGLSLRSSGFDVTPFSLNHDVDNVGYVIQKGDVRLLYASDTASIDYKVPGLTHMLVECNYSEDILANNVEKGIVHPALADRIRANHYSLERLLHYLSIIDKSKLQRIVLCHLSNKNSDAQLFQNEVEKATGLPVHIAEKKQNIKLC